MKHLQVFQSAGLWGKKVKWSCAFNWPLWKTTRKLGLILHWPVMVASCSLPFPSGWQSWDKWTALQFWQALVTADLHIRFLDQLHLPSLDNNAHQPTPYTTKQPYSNLNNLAHPLTAPFDTNTAHVLFDGLLYFNKQCNLFYHSGNQERPFLTQYFHDCQRLNYWSITSSLSWHSFLRI